MFTGLVEGTGEIAAITRMAEGLRLAIASPFPASALVLGESVSVSGACLTVVATGAGVFEVEVSPETLAKTTLGLKKARDKVNLERALRVGDRLGGHLVTGHVDGIGVVRERRDGANFFTLGFDFPPPLAPYLIEKGSIAVDGVSLTVNTVQGSHFSVYIIPHTARKTTLAGLKVGDKVNLETDLIGKYVARLLGPYKPGKASELTEEALAKHGFL
jgi:riboflavin synthase|uniref:Riboflavin synthase n=1 Tax=Desulfobacca acetoxidans TaxID=60893 RepID=A0A7C3WRT7_9BACT